MAGYGRCVWVLCGARNVAKDFEGAASGKVVAIFGMRRMSRSSPPASVRLGLPNRFRAARARQPRRRLASTHAIILGDSTSSTTHTPSTSGSRRRATSSTSFTTAKFMRWRAARRTRSARRRCHHLAGTATPRRCVPSVQFRSPCSHAHRSYNVPRRHGHLPATSDR